MIQYAIISILFFKKMNFYESCGSHHTLDKAFCDTNRIITTRAFLLGGAWRQRLFGIAHTILSPLLDFCAQLSTFFFVKSSLFFFVIFSNNYSLVLQNWCSVNHENGVWNYKHVIQKIKKMEHWRKTQSVAIVLSNVSFFL